jgi:hypothetical protein
LTLESDIGLISASSLATSIWFLSTYSKSSLLPTSRAFWHRDYLRNRVIQNGTWNCSLLWWNATRAGVCSISLASNY